MQQKSKGFSTYCFPICLRYTRQALRNLNNISSPCSKYYPRLLNDFLSDIECTSLYIFIYLYPNPRLVYQIYSMPSLERLRYDFLFTGPF
jgi:hypothetical protein